MEYDAKHDVFVSVCDELPNRIKGLITADRDGNQFILINSRLSDEQKDETLRHEMLHLARNDLYSDRPASEIEVEVDVLVRSTAHEQV